MCSSGKCVVEDVSFNLSVSTETVTMFVIRPQSPIKSFMKICRVCSESLHADRRTDMTKLIVFSSNFVNAPDDTSFVTIGIRTGNDNDQWGNDNSK